MKFMHLADLHIGKRVKEFSLLEDQEYILNQIIEIVKTQDIDCIFIAGDLYDKSVPPGEAIPVLDDFLTTISQMKKSVFIISGNHDSSERLSFGSRILSKHHLYIDSTFNGTLKKTTLKDEFGNINIFTLPFVRPARVQKHFPDCDITNYEEAVCAIIEDAKTKKLIDEDERNILVAHQFVTGGQPPSLSDSESTFVGTLEEINYKILSSFDYVALGHLHCSQKVGREYIRYAGSPLKYSFSEVNHKKSVTIVNLEDKKPIINTFKLTPMRDMRKIKGKINNLINPEIVAEGSNDFIHATITDDGELYEPLARLRAHYPNILHMEHIKQNQSDNQDIDAMSVYDRINKNPIELFKEFYQELKNEEFGEEKEKLLENILKKANLMEADK